MYDQRTLDRFWSKVDTEPTETGCLEWQAHRNNQGYGRFRIKNDLWYAHRVLWTSINGKIPQEKCVLHKCDNPSCVNIHHLFLGTKQDNIRDRCRKGRSYLPKGEKNGNAKLTEKQVRQIISDNRIHRLIAKDYNISIENTWLIKNNKAWLSIDRP